MFDQLTESNKDQNEARGRRGYFIVTGLLVGALFVSGVVWSLYGKDLVLGSGEMELSVMVMPVAPPENAPRPPQLKPERREVAQTDVKITTRQTNMLRIIESPMVPKGVSVTPNTTKERPAGAFIIDRGLEKEGNISGQGPEIDRTGNGGGPPSSDQTAAVEPPPVTTPPPPVKKIEPKEEKKVDRISGGVVNGKATNLPIPVYSAAARAIRAAGLVNVQVMIDENGNVISAKAVTGHALLRQSAEKAAWAAKFRPTLLSNEPVKVTGVIVYNFKG